MPIASTDVYTKRNIWPLSPFISLLSPFIYIILLVKVESYSYRLAVSPRSSRSFTASMSFLPWVNSNKKKLCVTRWHSVVNLSGSHHRRIFPISLYVATASCHTARPPVVEDIPGYIHPRAESYRPRSTRGNSS